MGFKDKAKDFFNSLIRTNKMDEEDYIEFREEKIELIKSEISDLIFKIDENESVYKEMLSSTDNEIEKGFDKGSAIRDHITQRHQRKQKDLIKELNEKKVDQRRQESVLKELLEKGMPAVSYGDSIVRGKNGGVLMLLRNYHDTFEPGKWGLPGGKIERGESARDGAIRELKEETNLTAIEAYPCGIKKLDDGGTISFFNVGVEEDDNWIGLDEEEHCNYCFMSLEELRRRPASDFIMGAKNTLLDLLDPFSEHMRVLKKGHEQGNIDEDTLKKASDRYTSTFEFSKKVKDY